MFDSSDPAFAADPTPALRRLQEADPVHFEPAWNAWYLSRYDDVDRALHQPDLAAGGEALVEGYRRSGVGGRAFEYVSGRMGSLDHGRHDHVRGAVAGAFSPRRVRALEPFIRATTARLVDACPRGEPFDILAALFHPLPSLVICELLGIDESDRRRFDDWTASAARIVAGTRSTELWERAVVDIEDEWRYMEELVRQRRAAPGPDLLSELATQTDRLTEHELIANLIFLFSAGHHTTRDLLGSGLLSMLLAPAQWRVLVDDPTKASAAVEEALRHDPPLPMIRRFAIAPTTVAGREVEPGQTIFCVVHAANRDPERFDDPDAFIVDRPDNRPLTFGGGLYHCIGAVLARLESRIVLEALARERPSLKLASDEIAWRDTVGFRGPVSVLVAS
jgi:cytochrome P450